MKRIFVGDFHLGYDEKKAVMEVLDLGRVSEWKKTREFENLWANYIGTKYSVALSSGTSALMAGWTALLHQNKYPIKKRKVITAPITYIATSNALVLTGYEPVYVDIDPKTFVITPENIKKHLINTVEDPENYVAINPVYLMGYTCDMDEITKIAREYNLIVVEDSAQAHGSIYNDNKAGSMSLFSIFSFYIAHNIQAGEMGVLNLGTDEKENLYFVNR